MDQLLISKVIFEDCKKRIKYFNIAWTDYQIIFDSIPHSWIQKSIELLVVNKNILKFWKLSTEKFYTKLQLITDQKLLQSRPVKIKREIFQGDSLSPLPFYIVLIPIIYKLNTSNSGYQVHGTERKIRHLRSKGNCDTEKELTNEIKIVKTTINDTNMKLWLEECAKISLKAAKLIGKTHGKHNGELN
jgi:hypothetical protein